MSERSRVTIKGGYFQDVGTVLRSHGAVDASIEDITLVRVRTVLHIGPDQITPPYELLKETANILRSTIRNRTPEAAEKAADQSGLKSWLIEHGIDIANLGVGILALFSH